MFRGVFEGWHVVILLVVLVVLFGAKRLPDASRSIGRSMKIFKSEIKDLHDDDKPAVEAGSAPVDAVRTEPVRTESARTEPVRTESARTEVTPSPDIRIEAPRPVTPTADRQPADHHSV